MRLVLLSPTPTRQRWQTTGLAVGVCLGLPVQSVLDQERPDFDGLLAGVILPGILGRRDGVNHPRIRNRGAGRGERSKARGKVVIQAIGKTPTCRGGLKNAGIA